MPCLFHLVVISRLGHVALLSLAFGHAQCDAADAGCAPLVRIRNNFMSVSRARRWHASWCCVCKPLARWVVSGFSGWCRWRRGVVALCGLGHRATASFSYFCTCTILVLVFVDRAALTPAPEGCQRLRGPSYSVARVHVYAATSHGDVRRCGAVAVCATAGVGVSAARTRGLPLRARLFMCVLACRSSVAAAATPPHRSVVVGVCRPFIIGVLALLLLWR